MLLDGADWVTDVRYESWHVRGVFIFDKQNTRNVPNDFRAILNEKKVSFGYILVEDIISNLWIIIRHIYEFRG